MMSSNTVPITCFEVGSTSSTDALQAVKQDPAVLEAQIRVEKRNTPSPVPENKTIVHQKPFEEIDMKGIDADGPSPFEESVRLQKAAVLSLAPTHLDLLLQYAGVLRLQRHLTQNQDHLECAFCKNNGERSQWYSSHILKDSRGRVRCPVLRGYRCPACGATGDRAHTIKYCPEYRHRDRWGR